MNLEDSEAMVESNVESMYLFYEHFGKSAYYYTLYKIDVDLTRATTDSGPSLILEFRNEGLDSFLNFVPTEENEKPPRFIYEENEFQQRRGMRCVPLGSKLYFLGGTNDIQKGYARRQEFPLDVHVLDLLTQKFTKMDASLNAKKPYPSAVFAANGKLYALASIPAAVSSEELSHMKLFECFDPNTGKWELLENLPPVEPPYRTFFGIYPKSIEWGEWNVLRKRQEVVLRGIEHAVDTDRYEHVSFVYHIQSGKWTRYNHGLQAFSLQEGRDNDYLYGLPCYYLPPVKLKSIDVAMSYETSMLDNGLVKMSSPSTPKTIIDTVFAQPYLDSASSFLRYLGNDHFCYIACGMCEDPSSPKNPRNYDDRTADPHTRGIIITLFKEKKNHGGENLCFQTKIMHSQDYRITGRNENNAQLVDCFVVDVEKLQKRKDKKKKEKNSSIE